MNVNKHRGLENMLLRRVQKHQSMSVLFRAPDMDTEKLIQPQTNQVAREAEPAASLDPQTQTADMNSVVPAAAPETRVLARQVVSPSAPAPQVPGPLPQTPPILQRQTSAPLTTIHPAAAQPADEAPGIPDSDWKRLQTIFRKHQQPDDPQPADTAEPRTDTIAAPPPAARAKSDPELPQAISANRHLLAGRDSDAAVPAPKTAQRPPKSLERKPEIAGLNVQRKAQPDPSTYPQTTLPASHRSPETEAPAVPDEPAEIRERVSSGDQPEKQALPLEALWNIQRVEAPHPLINENTGKPMSPGSVEEHENESYSFLMKTSQTYNQKPELMPGSEPVQLQPEDDIPTEPRRTPDASPASSPVSESRQPVEILSPGRPRPPQINLPQDGTRIQRQSQDRNAAQGPGETPPVNTVIGPLPADLWWLLGQEPPSAAPVSQPDTETAINLAQRQASPDQGNFSSPQTPTEQAPAETVSQPHTIQRQVITNDPLPTVPQAPAEPARTDEARPAGPDLDELARRVYAEVRRRLAAEWERRR
jgi:hypothetical protein